MILVEDDAYTLLGMKPARIFRRGRDPIEVGQGKRLDEYLK
jgi:hypothetical protein